jgi:hypothetical protein
MQSNLFYRQGRLQKVDATAISVSRTKGILGYRRMERGKLQLFGNGSTLGASKAFRQQRRSLPTVGISTIARRVIIILLAPIYSSLIISDTD